MKKKISLLIAMIMALTLVVVAFAAMPASAESTYIERATTVATDTDVVATVYASATDDITTRTLVAEIKLADMTNDVANSLVDQNVKNDALNATYTPANEGKYIWVEFEKLIINITDDASMVKDSETASNNNGITIWAAKGKTTYVNGNGAIINFDPVNAGGGGRAIVCNQLGSAGKASIVFDNLDLNCPSTTKFANNIQIYALNYDFNNCNLTAASGNNQNRLIIFSGQADAVVNINAGTTLSGGGNQIKNAGTGTFNVNSGATISGKIIATAGGTVNITGGTVNGNLETSGGSKINVSGGTVNGTVTVSGGSANAPAFKITSGTVNNPDTTSGWKAAVLVKSGAFAEIAGGKIESQNCPLQTEATSTVTMTGGTVTVRTGSNAAAINGTFNMSGGSVKSTGSRAIAYNGGSITVSGTALIDSIDIEAENATLTVNGGTVSKLNAKKASSKAIINGGTVGVTGGTVNVGDPTVTTARTINAKITVDAAATVNINAGVTLTSNDCTITINKSGGKVCVKSGAVVTTTATGTWVPAVRVYKDAILSVEGGTVKNDSTASAKVPILAYEGGKVEISSGLISSPGTNSAVGLYKNSSLKITGGTVECTGTGAAVNLKSATSEGKATITMTGGTLKASSGKAVNYESGALLKVNISNAIVNGSFTVNVGSDADKSTISDTTITGNVVITGAVADLEGTIIQAVSGVAFDMNGGATVTAYMCDFRTTTTEIDPASIAARANNADFTADECNFATASEGNEVSAFRLQGGKDATLTNCTFTSAGTHPTIRSYQGTLTLNNCTVANNCTAGGNACAVGDLFNTGTIIINGGKYTGKTGKAVIRIDKASDVTLNNCHVECTLKGENAASAVVMDSGAGAAKLTLNGGTYISDARPVIRNWSTSCTFNMYDVKIYSTGTWSDAYWAWASAGGTGTKDNWVAFVRSPAGSADQYTGGQFNVANAEASVVIGGETYYVYTGAKGGAPVSKGGASVRIEGDDAGLRFTSYISIKTINAAEAAKKDGTTVEYGTAIFPTALITAAGLDTFDPLALEELGYTVAWIPVVDGKTEVLDANDAVKGYTIRGALTEIKEAHYDWKYSAIAYIKYTNADDEVVYLFGNYSAADNSRSIVEVAEAALDDTATKRGGAYIYKCEDGTYSPYTAAQREILKGYID